MNNDSSCILGLNIGLSLREMNFRVNLYSLHFLFLFFLCFYRLCIVINLDSLKDDFIMVQNFTPFPRQKSIDHVCQINRSTMK